MPLIVQNFRVIVESPAVTIDLESGEGEVLKTEGGIGSKFELD